MKIGNINSSGRFTFGLSYILGIVVVLSACAEVPMRGDPAVVHAQGEIGDQQGLWRQRAGGPDLSGLEAGTGDVSIAQVLQVEANPAARGDQSIPSDVATLVMMQRVPDGALGDKPLAMRGRVLGVRAETLTIEAPEGSVQLLARVGGRALLLEEGDEVDIEVRTGGPFHKSDYVQLRGEKDAMGYALVGGESPVTVELPFFDLVASQDGALRGNTMGVTVRLGAESKRVQTVGETIYFESANLYVQVLASVAANERAAAVLSEPHRLEIAVWPGI